MEAESIFHNHLDTNAPMPVNIDSSAVKDAEEHLQNPNNDMFRLQQQQVKWVNLFVLIEVESIGSNQRYLVHLLFKWEQDAFCPALQDLVCEISLNEGNWDTRWTSFETFNGCSKMQYGLKTFVWYCSVQQSIARLLKSVLTAHALCSVGLYADEIWQLPTFSEVWCVQTEPCGWDWRRTSPLWRRRGREGKQSQGLLLEGTCFETQCLCFWVMILHCKVSVIWGIWTTHPRDNSPQTTRP